MICAMCHVERGEREGGREGGRRRERGDGMRENDDDLLLHGECVAANSFSL